jgi:hypothetical protein
VKTEYYCDSVNNTLMISLELNPNRYHCHLKYTINAAFWKIINICCVEDNIMDRTVNTDVTGCQLMCFLVVSCSLISYELKLFSNYMFR